MVGFALLIVSRLSSFALPASSKFLVDEVITRRNSALLGPLAAVIIAATLVQALTALALSRVLGMAAQRVIMGLRRDLQRKVMRLPIAFFDSTKSGALIARIMTDPDALRNLLGTGLILTAGNILTALLALIVLLWLNWRLTAMTLALLSTFGVLIAYSFKIIRPLFRQRAEIGAQVVGRLAEALAGVRVVKAYRAEEHENKVFGAGLERLFASVAREVTASAGLGAFATAVLGGISATLVFFGGREVLAGSMTLGDFVMFVFFIGLLLAPVVRIAEAATQLSEAMAGLDRIREVSQMETEEKDDRERESLPAIRGAIEFQDVTFEYTAGIPVLKGISFRAPPDSTTALVGPSGAGKSTVIGLVMGFYRPTGGRILVDGHDLSAVRTRDFRAHLGVVLQENFLFDGTIAENIGYAKPSASREQIVAAAQAAHCDHFVELLENGYETMVGERGVKLSGGQRQRVAIARAILANPRLLILDEATSSLDSESEALVQDGLRSLRQGRTTFVIAHRLSTIHSADQILVLEAGEIVERGNHQSLMAQQGRYRQLHERQFYIEAGSPTLSEIDRFGTPETLLPPAAPSEGPLPVLETLLHRRRGPGSV
ncbi:MAG TPA: ABC transporter ATP-binding protein [Vicinamibacteria bacterium]|nr:ABC transporter ATP-binding protein [Vicinamibacteria bacterium]